MKQLTRAELEAYARIYLPTAIAPLKQLGIGVAVIVVPMVDPEDGKAVVCTSIPGGLPAAGRLFESSAAEVLAGRHFPFVSS